MTSKLKIPEEEVGRFLLAYHRGIFPAGMKLGASFLFYYGLMGYIDIKHEKDDKKSLVMIVEEFAGRLV